MSDPEVVEYVAGFQQMVDHYMAGTIPLNTRVHKGPRYGHFFMMPEDNLIHLYQGAEKVYVYGAEVSAPPLPTPVVMIYPKEGSAEHNHSASIPEAPWVTDEEREAAGIWIDYLRQDEQQRAFMTAGFRPVTGAPARRADQPHLRARSGQANRGGQPGSDRLGSVLHDHRLLVRSEEDRHRDFRRRHVRLDARSQAAARRRMG